MSKIYELNVLEDIKIFFLGARVRPVQSDRNLRSIIPCVSRSRHTRKVMSSDRHVFLQPPVLMAKRGSKREFQLKMAD